MSRLVRRTALVPAAADEIFDLLADPRRHFDIDGSGSVKRALRAPRRLSLGATFSMGMVLGLPYATRNTVVEFEEGRRIAWRHVGRHVWRYTLQPDDPGGGTWVTEEFDYGAALSPRLLELAGFPSRNARGIEATLARLQDRFRPPTA